MLHSSRKINPITRRFELDPDTGGELGMGSTRQRVVIAAAFNIPAHAGIIDDRALASRAEAMRRALVSLTDGTEPAIAIRRATALSERPGEITEELDWTDLNRGTDDEVQLP